MILEEVGHRYHTFASFHGGVVTLVKWHKYRSKPGFRTFLRNWTSFRLCFSSLLFTLLLFLASRIVGFFFFFSFAFLPFPFLPFSLYGQGDGLCCHLCTPPARTPPRTPYHAPGKIQSAMGSERNCPPAPTLFPQRLWSRGLYLGTSSCT